VVATDVATPAGRSNVEEPRIYPVARLSAAMVLHTAH
jgi:hypothetical protein